MASKTEYHFEDSELVFYVREYHEEARETLYNKYLPLLYKEINAVKKKADLYGIDLSDITQEALLAFNSAINNYKEDSDVRFITFATLCIKRRINDYIEKNVNANSIGNQKVVSLYDDLTDNIKLVNTIVDENSEDPLKILINKETIDEIIKKTTLLSDKELLALKYELEELDIEEIAKKMSKTSKQIYNLLYRAHEKLKKVRKYNR